MLLKSNEMETKQVEVHTDSDAEIKSLVSEIRMHIHNSETFDDMMKKVALFILGNFDRKKGKRVR